MRNRGWRKEAVCFVENPLPRVICVFLILQALAAGCAESNDPTRPTVGTDAHTDGLSYGSGEYTDAATEAQRYYAAPNELRVSQRNATSPQPSAFSQ